jgi:hypothetical protein
MRAAPVLSSSRPAAVSRQHVRRPDRDGTTHPSVAILASACRVAFCSTPRRLSPVSNAEVHGGSLAGRTNSPSMVRSSDLALAAPNPLAAPFSWAPERRGARMPGRRSSTLPLTIAIYM